MDEALKSILDRLYEVDSPCPSREVFDIPTAKEIEREAYAAAVIDADNIEGDSGRLFVNLVATSRGAMDPKLGGNKVAWAHHCQPLIAALSGDMLHFIKRLGRDEVTNISRKSGRGMMEAPVQADFRDAEFDGLEDVSVRTDKRVRLGLRFSVPLTVGDFKWAYP